MPPNFEHCLQRLCKSFGNLKSSLHDIFRSHSALKSYTAFGNVFRIHMLVYLQCIAGNIKTQPSCYVFGEMRCFMIPKICVIH